MIKKRKIGILALLCLACQACQPTIQYEQISAQEAIEMMEEKNDYIILDVRTQEEYDTEHIPQAILFDADNIEKQLPDKDQYIFVYCRSGNRSKKASQKLAELGYTNIYEFGGIQNWPGPKES